MCWVCDLHARLGAAAISMGNVLCDITIDSSAAERAWGRVRKDMDAYYRALNKAHLMTCAIRRLRVPHIVPDVHGLHDALDRTTTIIGTRKKRGRKR